MKAVKIHFAYRHVEKPWGGANNFIRALYEGLEQSRCFELMGRIEDDYDILFMNQLGTGPGGSGKLIPLSTVRDVINKSKRNKRKKSLVVRAVNLNRHASSPGIRNVTIGWWNDRNVIALLNLADFVIFQSAYQKRVFENAGYRGKRCAIIHNGAASSFSGKAEYVQDTKTLRLISTGSDRHSKRHDLIARFSIIKGVSVVYYGTWPANVDPLGVKLMGVAAHDIISNAMADCHYFLFPAEKDMCPNSVVEALCAGLPVIYSSGPGGVKEVVGEYGIAISGDDLTGVVQKARSMYGMLYNLLMGNRAGFHIEQAVSLYMAAFHETVNGREA